MFEFIKSLALGKKEPTVPVHMMQIRFSTPPVTLEQEGSEYSAIDKFTERYGDVFKKQEHIQLHDTGRSHELNRNKKHKPSPIRSLDQLSIDLFKPTV